jgi:anti-anti-sigma factor
MSDAVDLGPARLRVWRHARDVVVADVDGEVDLSNTAALEGRVVAELGAGVRALVLDLQDVRHLDSSGIRLLHRLLRDLSSRGQRLRALGPAASGPATVLALTGMNTVLPFDADLPAALAAIGDGVAPDPAR